jgi:hypothetical protein
MGTWQLFVDETGDFSSTRELAIAGVLFEGYASPQLSISLRAVIERVFVGVPYPPHAAHHNRPSALLWGPLRGVAPLPSESRFARRTSTAANLARRSTAKEAVEFRNAVKQAVSLRKVDVDTLSCFDQWLRRAAAADYAELNAEAEQHRADLVDFLDGPFATQLGSRTAALAGAWMPELPQGHSRSRNGDNEYVELYETLLERVLAFVASREGESQLWVHAAPRGWIPPASGKTRLSGAQTRAVAHPILRTASRVPAVICVPPRDYDDGVHPGVVIADFVANRLSSRVLAPTKRWADVLAAAKTSLGMRASALCNVVKRPSVLPAISATGITRDAVRLATAAAGTPPFSGPLWAREQAAAWIEAIHG